MRGNFLLGITSCCVDGLGGIFPGQVIAMVTVW